MKISCIIPARGGSKGLPNKNILNFNGKPLISYSIKQSLNSRFINDVWVSSDSDEILEISKKYGANTIKRPYEISTDMSSSESAILHSIEDSLGDSDIIVFLQATSPLRDTKDIDNCIETLLKNNYDSLFSSCILEDFLFWEKDEENFNSKNYDYKNRKRRQDHKPDYLENGSIYVFKKDKFLIEKNRLFGKIGVSLMEIWKMFEIDDLSGFELCELIYKNKMNNE
jgi:CMP-N,N'-diacetyllegionaminic acid synthase